MNRINDIKLGLKLMICYINYGRCIAKRAIYMDKKVITIKKMTKLNKLNLKISKLQATISEIESLV